MKSLFVRVYRPPLSAVRRHFKARYDSPPHRNALFVFDSNGSGGWPCDQCWLWKGFSLGDLAESGRHRCCLCTQASSLIRVFTDSRSGGNEETKNITGIITEIKSESGVSTLFKGAYLKSPRSEVHNVAYIWRVVGKKACLFFFYYKTASAGIVFIS